jgi:oligoribonuclease (3'-5' exoribonuclease)
MERKLKDLTIREHIAIEVLSTLIATSNAETIEEICEEAVFIADTLLKTINNENLSRHRRNNLRER